MAITSWDAYVPQGDDEHELWMPSLRCDVCGQIDAVNDPCACYRQRIWSRTDTEEGMDGDC